MASKQALRDLQARLAERLSAARTEPRGKSWLAVECAGRGLLFPLPEAGEIFAPVPVLPVPYSAPWFIGVANLRGHLHGVVDLAVFLGLEAASQRAAPVEGGGREQARLVGFNQAYELNCVLWVDRLAGLRGETDLAAEPAAAPGRPAFAGALYHDKSGRVWQELNLAELAVDDAFLKIAR